MQDTFIRAEIGKPVRTYYSYNPPRNPFNWVNIWVKEKQQDGNYYIHHSTYLDDFRGFLSKQMIEKIENYRVVDNDYYRWMYLGEVIGLGDTVYNTATFNAINYRDYKNRAEDGRISTILENDPLRKIYLAADAGHQISATTVLAVGITRSGNVILLNTYYYSPAGKVEKKPPSQLSKDIFEFRQKVIDEFGLVPEKEVIDSAEGALRNQYYNDYSIRMKPVAKKKKLVMIDYVSSIFAEGRFYYLARPENMVFVEEHKKYAYEGKTINTPEPKVIEVDDHTCDAFQYFVLEAASELRLEW